MGSAAGNCWQVMLPACMHVSVSLGVGQFLHVGSVCMIRVWGCGCCFQACCVQRVMIYNPQT
jgi:hypothetical protein